MKSKIVKISQFLLIFIVIAAWIFSGWPRIWNNPAFPPKIQEAQAYATLTYVGGAEASGNSASFNVALNSLTGGVDTAARTGDLVIVATGFVKGNVGTDLNPGVSTDGFAEVADLWADDTREANFSVNWKIMTSTPDTAVACNGSALATDGAVAVVHVWRGADQSTPLNPTTTTATAKNASNPDSPSITPVTAGSVIISAGLGTMAAVDNAVTAPANFTNQVDISVDPGNAATIGIASYSGWSSGAYNPAAWTNFTTSTSDGWGAATLAIQPAPSAPTVSTQAADPVGDTTATCNGTIDATGGTNATSIGCDWDTDSGVPYVNSPSTAGDYGAVSFTQALTGLPAGTIIYARAFATNVGGTGYGDEINFLTGLSTAISIRNVADSADVSTITFPAGDPSDVISNPTGNVNVQVLTATASEAAPVAILKSATAYKLWYNVTASTGWTDTVASEKLYVIAIDGELDLTTFNSNAYNMTVWGTDQETTQTLAAGINKELYLQVTLTALAGKTGTSTLTILGET